MPEIVGRLRPPRVATAPSSPANGEMYYDTGTNKLYWWNGTSWIDATGGGGGGSASPAFVFQQQANARNAAALDQTMSFTTKNTAVGSVFVFVATAHSVLTFSNMRDSSGNAWTALGTFNDATNGAAYGAWACVNATGGVKQTATITLSSSTVTDVWLFEFSGVSLVAQDGSAAGVVTSARPITTPAFLSSPGALWFNASISVGTMSYGSPWTGFVNANGNGCAYYVTPGGVLTPNAGDNGAGGTASFVFGLKPSATAVAPIVTTTYYVSNSGSNSNDGKSTGAPWQTVAKVNAAALNPGDQVLFNSGQTFSDAALAPSSSGTDGAPIHYGTYGTAGNAVLSKGIAYIDQHWLVFESLSVVGAGAGLNCFQGGNNSGHYSHHITIRRCLFDNGATTSTGVVGVVIYGDDATIEDSTIQNTGDNGLYLVGDQHRVRGNLIQNTGLNTGIGSGKHGIYFNVTNGEITDNTIYNSFTDGLSPRFRNSIIRGNTIIGCSIGIAYFEADTVAGTHEWVDNYIAAYPGGAGMYVPSADINTNIQSFVIARNTIAFMFGAPAMDLNPLSGSGTYYIGGLGQNLATNPSAEVDTSGWVTTGGPVTSGATLTRVARAVAFPATAPRFASDGGTNEFKVVTTAVASEGAAVTFTTLPKGNYVFTCWVRGNAGGETVTATGGTGSTGNKTRNYTLTTAYQQVVLPFSVQDSGTVYVGIITQSATIRTFFFDTVQILAIT